MDLHDLPIGMVFEHLDDRITLVEVIDGGLARFAHCDTGREFLVEAEPGLFVRPTLRWMLEEFGAGHLKEAAAQTPEREWRDRFLGLDRAAVMSRNKKDVAKYDIALEALKQSVPWSAEPVEALLRKLIDGWDRRPSARSVMRWMDSLLVCDRRVGAMANRSGRRPGSSPLAPKVDKLVHQATALYWSVPAMAKMDAPALVEAAWRTLKDAGATDIGEAPPSKTTVVNRINRTEGEQTWTAKYGRDEAAMHFRGNGESGSFDDPFDLVFIDGVELEQVCLYSDDWKIPSSKMKIVAAMSASTSFVFPSNPFVGPYRAQMGLEALLGPLAPPVLDPSQPGHEVSDALCFGRIGRLRGDNDKALIPPSAIGNIAALIDHVELAKTYGPNEKSPLENYWGWVKKRLKDELGTVLSPRSRRRSPRRDPVAEAGLTRAGLARKYEALRQEWNRSGHATLGGRSPRDLVVESVLARGIRFVDGQEIRRSLARTERAILTKDGILHDEIRYRWNRPGITAALSGNLFRTPFAKRLRGTAKCEVHIRVYDWNLDMIEVWDEARRTFVKMWSTDPEYAEFLTKWEHTIYKKARAAGAGGAQTKGDRLAHRAATIRSFDVQMPEMGFRDRKKASALLACEEFREKARNVKDDPDLADFDALLFMVPPGGSERVDDPVGPPQRSHGRTPVPSAHQAPPRLLEYGWGGHAPEGGAQLVVDDDPDGGIDWDEIDEGDRKTPAQQEEEEI